MTVTDGVDEGSEDEVGLADVVRLVWAEVSPYSRVLTVILGIASVVGALDSVRDADGDRLLGSVPLAVPSVVAVWATLELLWRRSPLPLGTRLFVACIIAPIPSAVISTIAWAAAGLSPWGQDAIQAATDGGGNHYYWPDDARGPGALFLMLVGSWGWAASSVS